jgi:hypothetical protein
VILDLRDVIKNGSLNHPPVTTADLDEQANPDASPLVIALLSLDDADRDEAITALWEWARDRRAEFMERRGRTLVDLPADLFEVDEFEVRNRAAWCSGLKPLCQMVKP